MQGNIQIYENIEFGKLEVLIINGKPYFPATESATVLGYKNPHKATGDHCPHLTKREVGVKTGVKADGSPAMQTVKKAYIPEGDLYRLIIRSKLPSAVRFEAWVCDEVLPSIRTHGAY
jgi:prophage antirepressor-like protein